MNWMTVAQALRRLPAYRSLRIFVARRRKLAAQLIHLFKYRFDLVPRMPIHSPFDTTALYYPSTPFETKSGFREDLFEELSHQLDIREFEKMEKWMTTPPRFMTIRVNTLRTSPKEALERLKEVHAIKCIRRQCDAPNIFIHPQLRDLIVIEPQKSASEVRPDGKEVIVDIICGQAVLRGADVYCRGVSAAPLDLNSGDKVAIFADLEGRILKGWSKPFNGKAVFVANAISHVSRSDLFCKESKTGLAFEITENLFPSPPLHGKFDTTLFPQNLPSAVCVHVLDPRPGETILDMCAAPGGKTLHIATLMGNRGLVIALDRSGARVKKLKENVERWGLADSICPLPYNAIKSLDESVALEQTSSFASHTLLRPPFRKETFDRILVDAPCSGTGQRPKLLSEITILDVRGFPVAQKLLLSKAFKLLKVGGTLVYSTCSVTICENEQVVDHILKEYPGYIELVAQVPHLGGHGWRGAHDLSDEQLRKVQRFSDLDGVCVNRDTIGFFLAKFIKLKSI